MAIPAARCSTRLEARYGAASDVPVDTRGAGNASRQVNNFGVPGVWEHAEKLVCCRADHPAGQLVELPAAQARCVRAVRGRQRGDLLLPDRGGRPGHALARWPRLPPHLHRARAPRGRSGRARRDVRGARPRRGARPARLPRTVHGIAGLPDVLPQRDGRSGRRPVDGVLRRPDPCVDPRHLGGRWRSTRGARSRRRRDGWTAWFRRTTMAPSTQNATRRKHHDRHDPTHHRPGPGPLDDRAAVGAARRQRGPAVPWRLRDLRPRQRPRPGHRAAREARRAADVARPERAGHGPRRGRLRPRDRPPPGDAGDHVRRPGCAQHGHRRRRRARQPAARPAAARRHLRRARSRPGPPAGRALRRPHDLGQRRVPLGVALLRPHHPARAAALHPSAGGAGAHRPGRLRPGRARDATGRPGRGVRLPARDVRAAGAPRPAPAAGPRRPRRRGRDAPQRASVRCSCVGGGVRYSGAAAQAVAFAEAHGVPVVETVAGRTLVPHEHRLYGGALGIIGATSANDLAAEADVVLAVGTRLQDFTTSSWTGVRTRASASSRSTPPASTRSSTRRRPSWATPGRRWTSSPRPWATGRPTPAWAAEAARKLADWDAHVDRLREGVAPDGSLTYAQVVGVVNDASGPEDYVLTASGGMPGELHGGWRTGIVKHDGSPTSGATMDLEYGFSCMGYEVVAPVGCGHGARADPSRRPGDGAVRRRVLPDAQLRALLRCVRRPPLRVGALRQLRVRRDPPAADQPGRRRVQQHAGRLAGSGRRRERARRLRRARPVAGVHRRGRARRRPASRSCGRRTTAARNGRARAAATGRGGLPDALLHLDRGRCLVGDGRAESLSGRESYDEAKQEQLRWL